MNPTADTPAELKPGPAHGFGARQLETAGLLGWRVPPEVGPADRAAALLVCVLIGMRLTLNFGFSLGLLAAATTVPLWWPTVFADRRIRVLMTACVVAVAAGLVLTGVAPVWTEVAPSGALSRTVLVLGVPIMTGALVWAATLVSLPVMTTAFGIGAVVGIPFNQGDQSNAWRFTYSLVVTVLILSLASYSSSLAVQLLALGALAGVGLLSDSRSNSAFLLFAGVILLAQRLTHRGKMTRRSTMVGIAATLAIAGFALYQLLVGAILEGAFGEATQQRTEAQIDRSGSLILGGRPELAASVALIRRHPWGMGSGVIATGDDILAAKEGMWQIGYDPNNGYVANYMFGSTIELHSLIGDFWIWFGPLGVGTLAVIAWIVIAGLSHNFRVGSLTALYAWLAIRFVWDLAFSPAYAAFRFLPLVLAIALYSLGAKVTAPKERASLIR